MKKIKSNNDLDRTVKSNFLLKKLLLKKLVTATET